MGLTGLSQLPQSVRDSLAPGEEPLAWQPVALMWGESRIGRSGRPRAIESLDLNPASAIASGPVEVDRGLFDRLLGGVALTGHSGCRADRLGRALQEARNARLAVTTARLLLFDEGTTTFGEDLVTGRKTWDAETTEMWSASRDEVSSVALRPRPLMAGRVRITFKDSSTVALVCGVFSPLGARRLSAALRQPS